MWSVVVWGINLLGLIISFIGFWLLFKGSPLDSLGYGSHAVIEPIFREEARKAFEAFDKRAKQSRLGFIFLVWGFAVQGIAMILQAPGLYEFIKKLFI